MNWLAEVWLLYAATCSAAGWLFSFFHILNAPAYLFLHIFFFISIALLYRSQLKHLFRLRSLHKIRARFFPARRSYENSLSLRRILPASFFLVAFLALLAGSIYSPNNFDALTYRLPRVLYWLQDSGWSWIHTINVRLNNRATGFEWLIAPQLSLLHTDRLLFLLNYFSFLLLPGLLFCLLRECRAQARTAWLWMWLFPLPQLLQQFYSARVIGCLQPHSQYLHPLALHHHDSTLPPPHLLFQPQPSFTLKDLERLIMGGSQFPPSLTCGSGSNSSL